LTIAGEKFDLNVPKKEVRHLNSNYQTMKKSFLFTLLILTISFSCQEPENAIEQTVDYEAFASELKFNLNQIATEIRVNQGDFSDGQMVSNIASNMLQSNYTNDQRALDAFNDSYARSASITGLQSNARTSSEPVYFSEFNYNLISQVDELWQSSNSPSSYKTQLVDLFEEVELSDVEHDEKEQALIYLISQLVSIDFIIDNYDLINPLQVNTNGRIAQNDCQPSQPECEESWWDEWGKCAAGVVGGAGSVGLGGFLGGAGVGTVTLPIIGTISGALVGGIGGAIFGGLAGAAASCGGADSGCKQPKCPKYECLPC